MINRQHYKEIQANTREYSGWVQGDTTKYYHKKLKIQIRKNAYLLHKNAHLLTYLPVSHPCARCIALIFLLNPMQCASGFLPSWFLRSSVTVIKPPTAPPVPPQSIRPNPASWPRRFFHTAVPILWKTSGEYSAFRN